MYYNKCYILNFWKILIIQRRNIWGDFLIQATIHGLLLALGLILPLGAQNIFIFNQGANHAKLKRVIPVIITAGLCDTILILLAVIGVSIILLTIPVLQLIIYIIGLIFLFYMTWTLWHAFPQTIEVSH